MRYSFALFTLAVSLIGAHAAGTVNTNLVVDGNLSVVGNSTLAGTAFVGQLGLGTNGVGWVELPPVTDMEGGTVYGAQTLNPNTGTIGVIAGNDLEVFWGDKSSLIGLGYPGSDVNWLRGNSAIVNVGDYAGNGMVITNCANIFNLGGAPGLGMVGTNSAAVFNIGDNAGKNISLTNTFDVFNIGNLDGNTSVYTDSQNIFNFGAASAALSYLTNVIYMVNFGDDAAFQSIHDSSTELFNWGHNVAHGMATTNCADIYTFGNASGFQAVLNNSSDVYMIGKDCGRNMSGSYTNVYLMGNNAQPTLTANQMVFGDSTMHNLFPAGLSSGAPSGGTSANWKFGSYKTNSVTVIATNYVEVEIGGVLRKLAVVQ